MSWLARLLRRLLTLTRRSALEAEMDREMRAHIELETAERVRGGMAPGEARAAALRDFGGLEAVKEAGRDARGTRAVEDMLRDVSYAARMFAAHRAFTISAVLTFALGIGAATAIFTVVYGVLLRPLPYAQPDRLIALWEHNIARGRDRNVVSVDNFESWRAGAAAFESMAALVPASVTLPAPGGPERVNGAEVSPGYFRLLGVRPMLGREFTDAEAAGAGVVIISESFWRTRLGADPNVIGRLIGIGGRPHTAGAMHAIVGVMPADFEPPAFGWLGRQDLWVPFVPTAESREYGRYLLVVARLKPGVSVDAAREDLAAVAAHLEQERPANRGWTASVVPLAEQITGDARTPFAYIVSGVALLLALAVTNVAILLLARMRRRSAELGLRRALGATDARVSRQILTECLMLGAAGAAAGIAAAYPLVDILVSLLPPEVPRAASIRLDAAVLLAAAGAAMAASLVVGAITARRGRSASSPVLRNGAACMSARSSGRVLIAAEVAIGLTVAVLAGLAMRSLVELRAVDLGFDPQGVVAARVALDTRYATPGEQAAFFDQVLERVRGRQDIAHAGITSGRPFGGRGPVTTVRDARAVRTPNDVSADARWADAESFRALGIPLLAGALFDGTDRPDGPVRTVINASMARALWPDQDPIGRIAHIDLFDGLQATVIGVVGDIHLTDARTPPRAGFYLSPGRFGGPTYDIVVRGQADPAVIIGSLRAALVDLDPSLPLHRIETLDATVAAALARDRFIALLLSAFALLALLLASVGIYGVVAADVASRRKEIGIRMALGACGSMVLRGMLARTLTSALAGIAVGAILALVLAHSMRALLFGVGAADAWSFVLAAGSLLAVTMAAALIPAAHAARVSPLLVLRGE